MSDDTRTPIRIDTSDLYSPQVNEFVEMQQALRRDTGPIDPQPLIIRIIYSSWFYLSIASGLGALLGWACLEPFFDDMAIIHRQNLDVSALLAAIFLFPVVAAGIGLFLGASEGIMCRNLSRATRLRTRGAGDRFRRRPDRHLPRRVRLFDHGPGRPTIFGPNRPTTGCPPGCPW